MKSEACSYPAITKSQRTAHAQHWAVPGQEEREDGKRKKVNNKEKEVSRKKAGIWKQFEEKLNYLEVINIDNQLGYFILF